MRPFDSTTVTYKLAPLGFNPTAGTPVSLGLVTIDVTEQIRSWDATSALAYLAISSGGPAGRVSMDSLESYRSQPPKLVVTYRP